MSWEILFYNDFETEFDELDEIVQDELLAHLYRLQHFGPSLGRPHVDTLKGSKYSNMKELRFKAANGVWRATFAFDPKRKAIVLCAGDKSGVSQKKFYKDIIKISDKRFSDYLKSNF